MPHDELLALLKRARGVLEHYLFEADGEAVRDDVAEVCMAIDDALPDETRVAVRRAELERSAA
jgi:CDP-glycerol glycerophosphotransferase (TagB/SpsB family)